jgi:WD40 repeat protein
MSVRQTPKQTLKGYESYIFGFVFLHDDVYIVSGLVDGTTRKWDYDTGLLVGEP